MSTHDPFAALRVRDFRLYSFGGLFAVIGQQMQSVAVGWELYERTNSAMALGWVGLIQALPAIMLALPAGHIADRFDRRRIVMITQVLMALSSLGLAALSLYHGAIYFIYILLLIGAIAR